MSYFVTRFSRLMIATVLALLAACGNDSTNEVSEGEAAAHLSATNLGEQTVLTAPDYLALEQYSAANGERGERQAMICKACHSFDDGGPNRMGPALFGFFGRGVGKQAGFDYSPAMKEASFIWTPRALDAWLAQPGRFLPGNRMAFGGVARQQDRDDLIAYLLTITVDLSSE